MSVNRTTTLLPVVLAIAAAAASNSCTVLHHERNSEIDRQRFETHVRSDATRKDVLDGLGPPHEFGVTDLGELIFFYDHAKVTERQISISVPEFEIIKVTVGRADLDRDLMVVIFDASGKVVGSSWDELDRFLGRGGSVQFITKVYPTVNTRAERLPRRPERWARGLLTDGHLAIDQAGGLDDGTRGLRITGAPKMDAQASGLDYVQSR